MGAGPIQVEWHSNVICEWWQRRQAHDQEERIDYYGEAQDDLQEAPQDVYHVQARETFRERDRQQQEQD